MSKGLLDVIASLKDEEQPSELLMAVLSGKTGEKAAMMDEQFRLPDIVLSESVEEREAALEVEQELLKPLP